MLSSINLTGGAQRRRTLQDQLQMREYFAENDLISVRASRCHGLLVSRACTHATLHRWSQADVHRFYQDGSMVLHARSLKYGKVRAVPRAIACYGCPLTESVPVVAGCLQLANGQLVSVPPALVVRCRQVMCLRGTFHHPGADWVVSALCDVAVRR